MDVGSQLTFKSVTPFRGDGVSAFPQLTMPSSEIP